MQTRDVDDGDEARFPTIKRDFRGARRFVTKSESVAHAAISQRGESVSLSLSLVSISTIRIDLATFLPERELSHMLYSNKIATRSPRKKLVSLSLSFFLSFSCQISRTNVHEEFSRGEKTERKKERDGTDGRSSFDGNSCSVVTELSHVVRSSYLRRTLRVLSQLFDRSVSKGSRRVSPFARIRKEERSATLGHLGDLFGLI